MNNISVLDNIRELYSLCSTDKNNIQKFSFFAKPQVFSQRPNARGLMVDMFHLVFTFFDFCLKFKRFNRSKNVFSQNRIVCWRVNMWRHKPHAVKFPSCFAVYFYPSYQTIFSVFSKSAIFCFSRTESEITGLEWEKLNKITSRKYFIIKSPRF